MTNTKFKNLPDTTTPLTAESLNRIYYAINALGLGTDTYDSTETYNEGDIVIYNYTIYECNADNTTGTWDSTKWDEVPIIDGGGS